MNCTEREVDLLKLVHDEAVGMNKLTIHLHLLFCRSCRARFEEFYAVSAILATKFENPRLGKRRVNRPPRLGNVGALLAISVLLVALLSFLVFRGMSSLGYFGSAKQNVGKAGEKVNSGSNFPGKTCD